jgi:glutamine phosphoribosylpyrophosphate amidotransferase
LSAAATLRILQKLEVSRYPGEKQPVGGYGAGIAVLLDDGSVLSEKVGKTADSPACQLADVVKPKLDEARVMVGHVRFPSAEFLDTAAFREAAQPYVEEFEPELTIVSAHNGRVENYLDLKKKLKAHVFESEKVGVIDSEIIPHYFGALLEEGADTEQAAQELLCTLKGKTVGSIALLHIDSENAFLHLLHKGWSRGLTVWTNEKGEVIFCTRPEPVLEELKNTLARHEFKQKVVIKLREDATLKLTFPILPSKLNRTPASIQMQKPALTRSARRCSRAHRENRGQTGRGNYCGKADESESSG